MRFSIIVPVYNAGEYFKKCLDVVMEQSFPDWELLVVDDGSTDDSGTLADTYAARDPRVRVLHTFRAGQLHARQTGLAAARGEYVLFLDSDDMWISDPLARLDRVIREQAPDIVMFRGVLFGDKTREGRVIGTYADTAQWVDKAELYRRLIASHAFNSLWLKAFRRELFCGDTTDYTRWEGSRVGEDKLQLLYPITQADRVYYIPDILYRYRVHPQSAVHQLTLDRVPVLMANEMFDALYAYMRLWGLTDPASLETVAVYYLRHLFSVYYGVRRHCHGHAASAAFSRYPWGLVVDRRVARYGRSRRLTPKEKLKFACVFRHVRRCGGGTDGSR
ncbi:MAG: glycosyltransferase family 2 protein [Clostridia bacterium]|nr:glycosyltransferase family 2 protein [Clostridia bacterium]